MLSMIVAKAKNDVIGGDNKLLWHISEDLKRFKDITTGHTIIMGRKTFESLGRILPNRHHVVITRDKNFKIDSKEVTIFNNIEEVIDLYKKTEGESFIIGGGEIYNQLFPYCEKLYLTQINGNFEGDTTFPKINFEEWNVKSSSGSKIDPKNGLSYEFIDLVRK